MCVTSGRLPVQLIEIIWGGKRRWEGGNEPEVAGAKKDIKDRNFI